MQTNMVASKPQTIKCIDGAQLIQTLEGICGHLQRWPSIERFLQGVFKRDELLGASIQVWAINKARSDVLDALEVAFRSEDAWPMIRKRTLNFFGRSGIGRNI